LPGVLHLPGGRVVVLDLDPVRFIPAALAMAEKMAMF